MVSIQRQRIDARDFIGIVYSKEWFPHWPEKDMPYSPTDHVVGKWREIESKITNMVIIAICRKYDDASMIYDSHRSKYQSLTPIDIPQGMGEMPGIKIKLNFVKKKKYDYNVEEKNK